MSGSKKKIAVIAGGNSAEAPSSYDSARDVAKFLDRNLYEVYLIDIVGNHWIVNEASDNLPGTLVDKNDFTIPDEKNRISFDCVFIAIHGSPGEDGRLQGYFELLGIPYTGSGILASAMGFNKYACKMYLRSQAYVLTPDAILLKQPDITEAVQRVGLPSIIKPNKSGSSYGVSKVVRIEQLPLAFENALKYDDEILVEKAVEGVEVTSGILKTATKEMIFPITETRFNGDFFDTESKLVQHTSTLVTPAEISKEVTEMCRKTSSLIYDTLECKGIVRIDYIIRNDELYFLEVNTVPGMMEKSSFPRQVKSLGMSFEELYTLVIEDAISSHTQNEKLNQQPWKA